MAGLKLKSGADFCNFEAFRMRLHNAGEDPTSDFGVGQIYFNTSDTSVGSARHVRLYDGTKFRSLAYLDDVDSRIKTIEDMLSVDTAEGVVSTWNEIQAFLDSVQEGTDLMDLLNGKLSTSGGTISSSASIPLIINSTSTYNTLISFHRSSTEKARVGHTAGVGAHLTNMASNGVLKITDAGALMFNDKDILTSAGGTIEGSLAVSSGTISSLRTSTRRAVFYKNASESVDSGTYIVDVSDSGDAVLKLTYNDLTWKGNSILTSAGGTIKGTAEGYTQNILKIDTDNAVMSAIAVAIKGETKAGYGYSATNAIGNYREGAFLCNMSAQSSIGIKDDGTPFYNANTLLHSGNVGSYAVKQGSYFTLDDSINIAGYGGIDGGWIANGAAMVLGYNKDYRWAIQAYSGSLGHRIATKYCLAGTWSDWKTIAFTDSTVDKAKALVDASENIVANYEGSTLYLGTTSPSFNTYLLGKEIRVRAGDNSATAMLINSSGNVTIGASDLAGTDAKLNVHNILSVSTESATPSAKLSIQQFSSPNAINGIHLFVESNNSSYTNARPLVLQNGYGNVGIGTNDPDEKLHVVGNLHVTGNIIADGEVSAGGAAEEGGNAGGGGAAEKITATIEEGLKFKEISHTLGDNVIVQVYEWNANGQTWDMVLTDIETTTNLVTVRFGNETDVPHKVVII